MLTPELKNWKNWLLVIFGVACLITISCRTTLDGLTPTYIPKATRDYIGDPNTLPVKSLLEAREIQDEMTVGHILKQRGFRRMVDDDQLLYEYANSFLQASIDDARAMQEVAVGGSGEFPGIIGLLGAMGIGGAMGKMLKRKGDVSPAEVEEIQATAKAEGIKIGQNGSGVKTS